MYFHTQSTKPTNYTTPHMHMAPAARREQGSSSHTEHVCVLVFTS